MADKSEEKSPLTLIINDEVALYRAYMPFFKNGGLFVPTKDRYKLNQKITVLLSLMKKKQYKFVGEVAWISPRVTQGGKEPGVGVHFNDNADNILLKGRIERYLANKLQSTKMTNTM